MTKAQQQQMEDSLPECCHSVCDETNGDEEELTDDEVQQQQMEDSLPECCHSVCDETKGGKEELTDDEVQQQQMEVCPQLENRNKYGTFF